MVCDVNVANIMSRKHLNIGLNHNVQTCQKTKKTQGSTQQELC